MKRIKITQVLLLIILAFTSGCSHENVARAASSVPVFGSFAAGAIGLDESASDYYPDHKLTEPGLIKGKWLIPNVLTDLVVSLDKDLYGSDTISEQRSDGTWTETKVPFAFPHDHFVITIENGEKERPIIYPFEAAYEAFTVFPCDIDRDGVDEIFLETGEGRGTSVHVRKLTVLKFFPEDNTMAAILIVPLNGYIPWQQDPLTWQRHYSLANRVGGGYDVIVDLLQPAVIPDHLASEEYLRVLQHPQMRFSYDPKHQSYVIKTEHFIQSFN